MTKTILFIPSVKDDDLWVLLGRMINDLGYEVVQASQFLDEMSSSEFKETFERHRPDLVIAYFRDLPATNGWGMANELCRALRDNQYTKESKLIYFFMLSDIHHYHRTRPPCEADVYMKVPFDIDELGEQIRKLIG